MFELITIILAFLFLFVIIYYIFFSPKSQLTGKIVYQGGQTREKVIALTFDDGPNEPYTSRILDILRRFNVKATFFPVGENIIRDRETLKKIFDEGHAVGNHSYSHSFCAPITSPAYKKEIVETQDLIEDIIGAQPALFRPPWFFRQSAMLKTAKKSGLVTITGTFGSNWEIFQVSPQKMAQDAIKKTRPGAILVFHDGCNNRGAKRARTVKAIEIVIPRLIERGYKFVTIPRLLKIKPAGGSRELSPLPDPIL